MFKIEMTEAGKEFGVSRIFGLAHYVQTEADGVGNMEVGSSVIWLL